MKCHDGRKSTKRELHLPQTVLGESANNVNTGADNRGQDPEYPAMRARSEEGGRDRKQKETKVKGMNMWPCRHALCRQRRRE